LSIDETVTNPKSEENQRLKKAGKGMQGRPGGQPKMNPMKFK